MYSTPPILSEIYKVKVLKENLHYSKQFDFSKFNFFFIKYLTQEQFFLQLKKKTTKCFKYFFFKDFCSC